MSYVEVHSTACHAGMDGECYWSDCPQEANGRANYQSHCPLDRITEAKRMNPEDYLTTEQAKDALADIIDLVQDEGEAVAITKDGKVAAVLIGWDTFQRLTGVGQEGDHAE
jgi:fructose-1,6-bisphosphatase/sedoheptulose 1,7-bisphosphatase-like protein